MAIVRPDIDQLELELESVDQSEAINKTFLTNQRPVLTLSANRRRVLPVVLGLAQPVHQDDHHGGGGDLEAGQGREDGDPEGEAGVPGAGGGGEEAQEAGVRGQEADQ